MLYGIIVHIPEFTQELPVLMITSKMFLHYGSFTRRECEVTDDSSNKESRKRNIIPEEDLLKIKKRQKSSLGSACDQ